MRIAFSLLRLSPENFWSMTPREFAAAIEPFGAAGEAPAMGDLTALMRQFPDTAQEEPP